MGAKSTNWIVNEAKGTENSLIVSESQLGSIVFYIIIFNKKK